MSSNEFVDRCDSIEKHIDVLRNEIKIAQNEIADLRRGLKILEKDTNELAIDCYPNITKIAFLHLQKFIIKDIMGPSNGYKPWLYFHIEKLFRNPEYHDKCDKYLKDHMITIDHIYLIERYIKKYHVLSDLARQYSREKFIFITKDEWRKIIISMLGDDEDDEDIKKTDDLLDLMETYIKVSEDGSWNLLYI